MRITLFLFFLLPITLFAQQQFLATSVETARELASASGGFVVIDFYANWCGPCKTMDDKVWSREDVQTAQRSFVNVRVDASYDQSALQRYQLQGIPALIIVDALGNEYYRKLGYMDAKEVISVLADFPASMQAAYAAEERLGAEPAEFNPYFIAGRDYQKAARTAAGNISEKLAERSSDALEEALEILHTKDNVPADLDERINLMIAENFVLRGRAKKALKMMQAYDKLAEKNVALACYIRGLAYHQTNDSRQAEECYNELREAVDNAEYLALYASMTEQ